MVCEQSRTKHSTHVAAAYVNTMRIDERGVRTREWKGKERKRERGVESMSMWYS